MFFISYVVGARLHKSLFGVEKKPTEWLVVLWCITCNTRCGDPSMHASLHLPLFLAYLQCIVFCCDNHTHWLLYPLVACTHRMFIALIYKHCSTLSTWLVHIPNQYIISDAYFQCLYCKEKNTWRIWFNLTWEL